MALTTRQKHALRHLTMTGTLSPAQEQAVREAFDEPGPARATSPRLLEVAGYLGGSLLLGGAALLIGTSWEQLPRAGRLALLGAATATLVVTGLVFAGGPAAVHGLTHWRRRVVSALFSLSAVTAAFAAGTAVGSHEFLAATTTCLVIAVLGQLLLPTPVGHLLLVVAGAATAGVWTSDLISDTPVAVGAALFIVGGVEIVLAAGGLLQQAEFGLALGSAVALLGAQQALGKPETAWMAYALTAALAVSGFVLHWRTRRIVPLITGIVSTTIVVPEAIGDWTDGAVSGGVLLLTAGAVLLATVGVALRFRRRSPSGAPGPGPPGHSALPVAETAADAHSMSYQVNLTDVEPVTTAHLHRHTTTEEIGKTVGAGFEELYTFVTGAGAIPAGPPQAAYPGDFQPGGEVDVDLYVPIDGAPPAQGGIDFVTLPGGPVAKTSHRGPYDRVGAAYEALFTWVREHGRTPAGPPRELYLTGPDTVTEPADYLTDVILPLRAE